jgi:hypothetical protein
MFGYPFADTLDRRVGMMLLYCHCGCVCVRTAKRPDFIHDCNCTLCQKTGAIWGYFPPSEVTVEGTTAGYSRDDKAEPGVSIRFCSQCGSTTHFELTEAAIAKFGNTMLGVNMRLSDQSDLDGVELRYPDGRAWSGEGDFGYVREARIIGLSSGS